MSERIAAAVWVTPRRRRRRYAFSAGVPTFPGA
jgi:hypothetical protein